MLVALVVPLGLYVLSGLAAAVLDDRSLAEVACFEPGRIESLSPLRLGVAAGMALGGVAFLFVVPGLLGTLAFMRWPQTRATAYTWSLAANSGALMLLCLALRHTVGIHRTGLAVAWLGWTAVWFVVGYRPGESWADLRGVGKRYGAALGVGLLAVAAAIVVFFPEQFVQCFNEDGTETYELARSLRQNLLPYWELETWDWEESGPMGTAVVNPSLVNSYWTCALQVLLGPTAGPGLELATRLPYWIWWSAIFAVGCRLLRAEGRSWFAAVPLALTMFLSAELFTFYVGYNAYMADLANPGVPDALFTLLLLLALDCLLRRDRWGWCAAMTMATAVLYAGPVLMVLTLAAAWIWQPIPRREVFRWGLRGGGLLLLLAAFYLAWGWWYGSLAYWIDTLDIEYVNDYLATAPRWKSAPLFAAYFVLGCGGVAAIGLWTAFRQDPWQRTAATTVLAYLAVVLGSGFKNLHYLGPLLPIPVILFLLCDAGRQPVAYRRRCWLCTGSTMLCIALCWPAARATFTLNRELGQQTTITADSYTTAVSWTRLRYAMRQQGVISWDCDQHTWAAYARWDAVAAPDCLRPFVLTEGGPPTPEYQLLASWPAGAGRAAARLYVSNPWRGEWLATQRPLMPLDRYPIVLRPLADGPFSPHNNTLEDVQRLRWPW